MKTKNVMKVLSAALFFVLLTTACVNNSDVFDLDFNPNEDGNVNLGGYTMKYALCASTVYGDTLAENVLGFPLNTVFSDLASTRIKEVETALNCKINGFYAADGANAGAFNSSSAAGIYYSDTIQGTSSSAKSGFFIGINTLSHIIDLMDSEKWGSKYLLESMCWKDDCYGVVPNAWPELNYTSFAYPMVANMNIAETIGWGHLREIVENYEWTWDKFHEVLFSATIKEGSETKLYGMVCHPQYLGEMMIRSNGDSMIIKNSDGTYSSGYYQSHAMTALTEVRNLYQGEYSHCFYKTGDGAPNDVIVNFVDGIALLTICDTEHLYGKNGKISSEIENFAILPAPTGPDVPTNYRFSLHESMRYTIAISIFAKDAEATAYIIDALYEPLPGFETKEDIIAYMTHNYFFDERDANVFFEMYTLSVYNYFTNRMRILSEQIIMDATRTVSQVLGDLGDQIQTRITEEITPARQAMDLLWSDK